MRRLDPKQLAMGVKVEKEHASTVAWLRKHPEASLDDAAAHIATDHLKELPDYYTLLDKMERTAKKKGNPPVQQLMQRLQENLTPDLLKPGYGGSHRVAGHCYVASEALWHLTGKKLHPTRARDEQGVVHWWLEDDDGNIFDVTADQYLEAGSKPPWEDGQRKGFLTKEPSVI